MDDLTSLRAIRRPTDGPTDAALAKAHAALDERMAAPTRAGRFRALVARLRRPSPLIVTFGTIAAVAVVGIVVASVYASGIRTAVQPAVPGPTASATPKPTVGSQQVFGGDCSTLFTEQQVGDALGSAVKLAPERTVRIDGLDYLPVIMRGGIRCTWQAQLIPGNAADPTLLDIVVLPETADVKVPYCYGTNKEPACSFGSVASGWWISGVAYGPKGSGTAKLITDIGTIESEFARAAASAPRVTVVEPAGAWSSIDCTTLSAKADLATVTSSPGLTGDSGNGAAEQPAGYYSAITATGQTNCIWEPSHYPAPKNQVQVLSVSIYPGASYVRDDVANSPGAKEISIAGTDGAVRTTPDGGAEYTVFSGSNALVIAGQATDEQLFASAAALVKVLNSN